VLLSLQVGTADRRLCDAVIIAAGAQLSELNLVDVSILLYSLSKVRMPFWS